MLNFGFQAIRAMETMMAMLVHRFDFVKWSKLCFPICKETIVGWLIDWVGRILSRLKLISIFFLRFFPYGTVLPADKLPLLRDYILLGSVWISPQIIKRLEDIHSTARLVPAVWQDFNFFGHHIHQHVWVWMSMVAFNQTVSWINFFLSSVRQVDFCFNTWRYSHLRFLISVS